MLITRTSTPAESIVSPALDRPGPAPLAAPSWGVRALYLVARAALDTSCLVRSRHSPRRKLRIFLEYARLTAKLMLGVRVSALRPERVLGYRVRHLDYGSLHFAFRETFVRNDYFFETTSDRPVIIDCGANIGLATLFFKWLYPRSEIHAFEPDPQTFGALRDNVEQNALSDVHLHNVALCDKEGDVDFFVPEDWPGSLMMSLLPGYVPAPKVRRIVVKGGTLSSYVEGRPVDFLKMDIEGAEERVLGELSRAGGLQRVREMIVEFHHDMEGDPGGLGRFLQLLEESGYQYQVDASRAPGCSSGRQDVLVWAVRSRLTGAPARPAATRRP